MKSMFHDAKKFNNNGQELTWNVKNVMTMDNMFMNATEFNVGISQWEMPLVKCDEPQMQNTKYITQTGQMYSKYIADKFNLTYSRCLCNK